MTSYARAMRARAMRNESHKYELVYLHKQLR